MFSATVAGALEAAALVAGFSGLAAMAVCTAANAVAVLVAVSSSPLLDRQRHRRRLARLLRLSGIVFGGSIAALIVSGVLTLAAAVADAQVMGAAYLPLVLSTPVAVAFMCSCAAHIVAEKRLERFEKASSGDLSGAGNGAAGYGGQRMYESVMDPWRNS